MYSINAATLLVAQFVLLGKVPNELCLGHSCCHWVFLLESLSGKNAQIERSLITFVEAEEAFSPDFMRVFHSPHLGGPVSMHLWEGS